MNNIWKAANGVYRSGVASLTKQCGIGLRNKTITAYSRAMAHMCSSKSYADNTKMHHIKPVTKICQCSYSRSLQANAEKTLADFLQGEIVEEKKLKKMNSLPASLGGFSIKADGAELSFEKADANETILVTMNVNNSVDTDDVVDDAEFCDEIKSKPTFEVDITKNGYTLNFCCSYCSYEEPNEEAKGDLYQIDEIALYKGEWNDKNYSVAGDILDENLYDLFMVLLSEKGISNSFVEEAANIATYYEHSKYIKFMEDLSKFSLGQQIV